MSSENSTDRSLPSWLPQPCPDWCTRRHLEDDHPEDWIHQDDGVVVPAIVAHVDPLNLRRVPVASELVVQRFQAVVGETTVWLLIGETETAHRLTVAAQSLPELRGALATRGRPD